MQASDKARYTPMPNREAAWTFYYDADCGMCASAVRWLRRFDWRNRLAWTAAQDVVSCPQGLTRDDLERSAYLVCTPGDNYEGFFAFRRLLTALPAFSPLGALMWLPGVRLIGVPVYRWIADNRHRLSGCGVPAGAVDRMND